MSALTSLGDVIPVMLVTSSPSPRSAGTPTSTPTPTLAAAGAGNASGASSSSTASAWMAVAVVLLCIGGVAGAAFAFVKYRKHITARDAVSAVKVQRGTAGGAASGNAANTSWTSNGSTGNGAVVISSTNPIHDRDVNRSLASDGSGSGSGPRVPGPPPARSGSIAGSSTRIILGVPSPRSE